VRGKRVVLGVTGGIASYKAVWLARMLTESGADVDVVMTHGAQEFVGAITFEAVTGRRVYTEIFGAGNALDHIRLAREADAVLVAPATADFLARSAHGHANDLLTAILLAAVCPVVIAPAMNDRMWAHPQTQLNVAHLRELGYTVIDPDVGPLAVGEGVGPGRLPEPATILAHLTRILAPESALRGKHVVVTAGATREPIDPVRFISNHSSGKMGIAIAEAAWRRGADVTVIVGHIEVPLPPGVKSVSATTTANMQQAVLDLLPIADVLIMAAAPADFAVKDVAAQKIKKSGQPLSLDLKETPDILKSTAHARRPDTLVIGFALETQTVTEFARKKLEEKQLDLIVANQAGVADAGFGVDTNRVTFIGRRGQTTELPLMSKADVAERLMERVEEMLHGR
jgi:phosphopantothenoylcysteine decarboxylase/phosphopantothenate--cysteine ligase